MCETTSVSCCGDTVLAIGTTWLTPVYRAFCFIHFILFSFHNSICSTYVHEHGQCFSASSLALSLSLSLSLSLVYFISCFFLVKPLFTCTAVSHPSQCNRPPYSDEGSIQQLTLILARWTIILSIFIPYRLHCCVITMYYVAVKNIPASRKHKNAQNSRLTQDVTIVSTCHIVFFSVYMTDRYTNHMNVLKGRRWCIVCRRCIFSHWVSS